LVDRWACIPPWGREIFVAILSKSFWISGLLGSVLVGGLWAAPPSFEGVVDAESVTYRSSKTHRVLQIDTKRFDTDLERARDLLHRAIELYGEIYILGEGMDTEGRDLAARVIRFSDKGKKSRTFDKAAKIAQELQKITAEVQPLVQRLVNFFEPRPLESLETYSILLDRHSRAVHVVTLYNSLRLRGVWRSLDFDTWRWGDEEDVWVLNPNVVPEIPFPAIPRVDYAVLSRNRSIKKLSGTGDGTTPMVREEVETTVTRSVLRRTTSPNAVGKVLDQALEAGQEANEAFRKLGPFREDGRFRFYDSRKTFDAAKEQAFIFSYALTQMLAFRNEAWSLLIGSDLLEASLELRASWKQVNTQIKQLSELADTPLRYDPLGPTDDIYYFAHVRYFYQESPPAPPARSAPPMVRPIAGQGLTTRTVINGLVGLGCASKVIQFRDQIGLINDLSQQNIRKIQNYFRKNCQDGWNRQINRMITQRLGG
jgi:hypothetical protein